MMPIEKYDKQFKEELGKTAYYVGISALQKCIRRGEAERAVNFAKLCWRMEPHRLFCRLWTILGEDCGRDIPALLAFYKHRGGGFQFEPLVNLVVALANARKSREVCLTAYWLKGDTLRPAILAAAVQGTVHEKLTELIQRWDGPEGQFSLWDYGVGDANLDWTIDVAERSGKFDWEKFCPAIPYFTMTDTRELTGKVYDEGGPLTIYDDFLPLEALDIHTRPGKHAINVFAKYRQDWLQSFGLPITGQNLGTNVFWMEGWLYRNYCPYRSLDIIGLWDQMEYMQCQSPPCYAGEMKQRTMANMTEHVLPELNKCRAWLIGEDETYRNDLARMKTAYYDQYWKLNV